MSKAAWRAVPWAGMAAIGLMWWRDRRRTAGPDAPQIDTPPVAFDAVEPGRGRMAEGPPQIPAQGWKDVLWRTWLEVGRDRLTATAGGVTFYTLLALFPGIAAFVSLYGLFADVGEVSRQLDQLAAFVPANVLELVAEQMIRLATARTATLSTAFLVSLFLSLWSANAGIAALFDGLNVVYGEREKRNFLVRRVVTFGFTCAALVFALAVTALLAATPFVLQMFGLGETLLIPLRWLLALALIALAIAVIYRYGPSRERARWRWVTPGAAGASVFWVATSLGFSWYLNHVAHYDATYGPLGAMVAFMMWLWVSVMVVLIGAELNAELEHQTAIDSTTGAPRPLGERGAAMADSVGPAFDGVRAEAGRAWAVVERQADRIRGRPVRPARPPAPPAGRPDPRRSKAR